MEKTKSLYTVARDLAKKSEYKVAFIITDRFKSWVEPHDDQEAKRLNLNVSTPGYPSYMIKTVTVR